MALPEENRPLKVAILGSRGIPARYGGFETFAEQISIRLAARGVDVTVFCESDGTDDVAETYSGVRLQHIRRRSLGPLSTVAFDAQCLWAARRRFDIVYMLGYGAAAFCLVPRLWGTHVWINMDGLEWARSKWSGIGRAYLRLMEWVAVKVASVVVADAEGIREDLVRRHGPIPNCKVLVYGTDTPDVHELTALNSEASGMRPGSYYLVVCRMEPENHVAEIVEGFLQAKTGRRLTLVGDVNLPTPYAQKLREINNPRVVMLGAVYDRKKLDAIRAGAHAYLHGHSVGGTNPSLLEAMAVGNVIVAHDNVFNREVTAGNGLFFRDAAGVARCIESIEALPEERRAEWVRLGLQRAGSVYSWEHVTEQYLSAFRESVGS